MRMATIRRMGMRSPSVKLPALLLLLVLVLVLLAVVKTLLPVLPPALPPALPQTRGAPRAWARTFRHLTGGWFLTKTLPSQAEVGRQMAPSWSAHSSGEGCAGSFSASSRELQRRYSVPAARTTTPAGWPRRSLRHPRRPRAAGSARQPRLRRRCQRTRRSRASGRPSSTTTRARTSNRGRPARRPLRRMKMTTFWSASSG